jgi:hypothetical protein
MKTKLLSLITALLLFFTGLKAQSPVCYTTPDGLDANNWSYKNYVIPTGYKLDSVYMGATRSGYPTSQYDFIFNYCSGTTTFNQAIAVNPWNYQTDNNSEYNVWINLTSFNYSSVGMVRVILPTVAGAVWNQVCFAISPIVIQSNVCFTTPDGLDANNWSYKNYVIPTGYKLDSVYMGATRSGYPADQLDFIFEYCAGTTTYNQGISVSPWNYLTDNNSEYNRWINLTSFNYTSVGVVRATLPTVAGAVWNQVCFAISPASCADITTGLAARFDFTGNATDLSGNNNNGTVNGATLTTDRFGNPNSAYLFNGTTDNITVNSSTSLNFQTANKFSISYWINPATLSASQSSFVINKQIGSGANQDGWNSVVDVDYSSGFRIQNGTSTSACALNSNPSSIATNQFYHIVQVYNNGTSYIYKNGILLNQSSCSALIGDNTSTMLIGLPTFTYSNVKGFNGKIDDIRIYNRSLSQCDVDSLFNMPNPITTGIAAVHNIASFSIYPNPANDVMTISINANTSKIVLAELYDLLGNTIYKKEKNIIAGENTFNIDLSELNSGIYFLRIDNSVQKIQIIK